MLVVIDGPAGAGKSSTAREIARRAGIDYIDSGALYRGFTLLYLYSGQEKRRFFELIEKGVLSFEFDRDESRVFLSGQNVSDELRSLKVNRFVSTVATFPEVREKISVHLKQAVRMRDCIAEGRDLGTVVFPDADIKIFLTASIDERARRRHRELITSEKETDLASVKQNLEYRDLKDTNRKADPLKKADDAIVIDTTRTGFNDQVEMILALIQKHLQQKK